MGSSRGRLEEGAESRCGVRRSASEGSRRVTESRDDGASRRDDAGCARGCRQSRGCDVAVAGVRSRSRIRSRVGGRGRGSRGVTVTCRVASRVWR